MKNNSKMGRPLKGDEPRNKRLSLRISESEMKEIEYCSKKLNQSKIDTVIKAIRLLKSNIE